MCPLQQQHGWRGRASAATSLDTTIGILTVNYKDHGGEVVFSGHGDDEYMAQVDINLNSGADGAIYFRYLDPDNWYRAVINTNGAVKLEKMLWGKKTTLGSGSYTPPPGRWSRSSTTWVTRRSRSTWPART